MTDTQSAPRPARTATVLLLPRVHVLDLAGPAQVLHEANLLGGGYTLRYCGIAERVMTAQGMCVADLEPLPASIAAGDLVLIPGVESTSLGDLDHVPCDWLRRAELAGAMLASICSGAFILGRAGLLDGRSCTTHWKVADRLQNAHPSARVMKNRLFVRSGRIITSAGVASGIDMALSLVEEDHGPLVAARVAREIVVYMRRNGDRDQTSVYLEYRTHLHPGIHKVQDWLTSHPDESPGLDALASIAGMSPRNLTRVFRKATGISLKEFTTRLRMEIAENLMHDPALTVDGVAARCGFRDSRHLRRLWKRHHGANPSTWKRDHLETSRPAPEIGVS